jgi:hypothetical protein
MTIRRCRRTCRCVADRTFDRVRMDLGRVDDEAWLELGSTGMEAAPQPSRAHRIALCEFVPDSLMFADPAGLALRLLLESP